MRCRVLIGFLFLLFSATAPSRAARLNTNDHIYSIPLTEAEDVVTGYLIQGDFHIYRQMQSNRSVLLQAERGPNQWQILLKHHSPLATRIQIEVNKGYDDHRLQSFWRHMEGYIHMSADQSANPAALSIPIEVRDHYHAVVCIYAGELETDLQISGFVVDPNGLIICTGHDLVVRQPVSVRFSDGRVVVGRVVKVDDVRDLALVEVDLWLDISVPLHNGRFMLYNGDRLYAITCPAGGVAGIEAGFLDGPPRRVAGLPLWQARMHIVHGSSGSPVFDSQGRLAAIVKGRFRGTDSVGFLIPFETLLHFLDKY